MSKLVKVTFDGIEVEVPEGMGLVEAAAQAGIEIPVFCHHHKLDPVGVCRMCLVEVEGQRKPVPAC
ncbi:MAG: 2Fe-2S iron-sulfur cluster-binding protein, partial [Limnochordales bacterium]